MFKKVFRNKCVKQWKDSVDEDFCSSCTEGASDFCAQCGACSCVCQCSQSQSASQSGVEGGPPTLRQFFSRPSRGVSSGRDLAVQGVTEEIFAIPPQMNMGQLKSLTRVSMCVEGILSVALVDTGSCANIISSQRFQEMQQEEENKHSPSATCAHFECFRSPKCRRSFLGHQITPPPAHRVAVSSFPQVLSKCVLLVLKNSNLNSRRAVISQSLPSAVTSVCSFSRQKSVVCAAANQRSQIFFAQPISNCTHIQSIQNQ